MREVATSLAILAAPTFAALLLIALSLLPGWWRRRYSLTDLDTGLANRAAMKRAGGNAAAVIVARMDRFNAIAATLSPDLANRVVLKVAERIAVANQDRRIYRTDEVSFAWMEQAGDEATLEDRLEAIDRLMRSPIDCGRLIDIRLSLGIASVEDGDIPRAIGSAGLAAGYADRKALRWHRFNGVDDPQDDGHLSLLSELDAAMTSGQLWNAYQPKIDLATGRIIGAEALVRWLHPKLGPIVPAGFIPLLEKYGRGADVALHVIARAIEDTVGWEYAGEPIGIAVNVPPALLCDSGFMEQVRKMLQNSGTPASRITIELSRMSSMGEAELEALSNWHAIGVGISVGDGDSSLSMLEHLHRISVSEFKIDQGLIRGLESDESKAAVVRSTIRLAHGLGIRVVAEGIENGICLEMLKAMGCDIGQGFHIGRPMSASNFRVYLGEGTAQVA